MKKVEIKSKNSSNNYSILIGDGVTNDLPKRIKITCPKTKKIAIISDKNVPRSKKNYLKKKLKNYSVFLFEINPSEKIKSLSTTNKLLEKLLKYNFSRSDTIIALGGGIIGDVAAFTASILKRGVNFINIPTTLLSQVDSSIGGKTGVKSKFGKNLIGSFFQPKLVIIDISFLKSLPKREMICGYAEILKHSIISDYKFFKWLKINTNNILEKRDKRSLIFSIKRSCMIKLKFVNKDVNEKNIRKSLNFGHTFAHAIEAHAGYANKINHGEAVLIGMVLAIKFSIIKKLCSKNIINEILNIYNKNKINHNLNKFLKLKNFSKLIEFMQNDKKNDNEKINLILLRRIGKLYNPNKFRYTKNEVKQILTRII